MYIAIFQLTARGVVLKIRLDSWLTFINWLREHPGMHKLRVEAEEG